MFSSVRVLENWPMLIADEICERKGLRPACSYLKLRNGLEFAIAPGSPASRHVFEEIFFSCVYEQNGPIEEEDCVIDIGAHVGFFALKAASLAKRGKVYAFEPCSQHFNRLVSNVRSNGLSNVEVSREAVWKECRKVEFRYALTDLEPSLTSLCDLGGSERETVSAVTLDRIFERHRLEHCDLLKIDAEGAEYEILFSVTAPLLRVIRRIALEWHRFDSNHKPAELAHYLLSRGFEVEAGEYSTLTGYLYARRS